MQKQVLVEKNKKNHKKFLQLLDYETTLHLDLFFQTHDCSEKERKILTLEVTGIRVLLLLAIGSRGVGSSLKLRG